MKEILRQTLRPEMCCMAVSLLFLAICLTFVTGCVRYQARPLSAARTADDFASRSLADEGLRLFLETNRLGGDWPRRTWDLESLTLAAFYFSPELDVARAQWGVASAGLRTAGQLPNPVLSASPGYNTTTLTPSPWIPAVNLDLPIETAGKRKHRIAQARHLSEAARLNIASVAWQVRGKVRQALVNLRVAAERESLLGRQIEVQEEHIRLLEAQVVAGAIPVAEVMRERIALDGMKMAVQEAKQQNAESRVALAEAVGVPVGALNNAEISFAGLDGAPAGWDVPSARRQALLNRADVLAALSEYAASEAALRLEVAKQYPDIHLSPGYEYDQGDDKWRVGLSVELPVLNKNRGPIAEAIAKRSESAAKFNALQARVVAEIERRVTAYQAAAQQCATADSMLTHLEQQARILRARHEAGDIGRGEVLAGEVELAAARLLRADAVAKAQHALAQLEEALQSPLPAGSAAVNMATQADSQKQK